MSIMGEVLKFPQKKELPKAMEEEFHKIAKNYMEVLYAAFEYFKDECETREDMDEVNDLVVSAYADGIEKAINELD